MISSKNVQIVSQLLALVDLANDAPDLVDAIEFRRDQYGLSKAEFACVLGLQNSHYTEIIKGKRQLSYNAARRAFKIGVPAEVLFK